MAAAAAATASDAATAASATALDDAARWADALLAAALLAVDPCGLGGAALRSRAGPVRERWLADWRALLPIGVPVRRMPLHIGDDRLLGGLDLAATLRSGRPVAQRGLLTECDGGALVVAMAERLGAGQAARLAAAMDRGELQAEREGLALQGATRWALIALDEGETEDERLPAGLGDRLAFAPVLDGLPWRTVEPLASTVDADEVQQARERLPAIAYDAGIVEGLCGVAQALGVHSPRAAWLAWRAARACAALRGARAVEADDAVLAVRLVLAPRATQLPRPPEADGDPDADADADADGQADAEADPIQAETDGEPPPAPQAPPPIVPPSPAGADDATGGPPTRPDAPLEDRLLEAAVAAIPAGLRAALTTGGGARPAAAGHAGGWQAASRGGRPIG
ncbi:MAG: hypothetical protein KGJ24_05875, partial [Burkholderiales bacterium]|nr:hypothetical protein [Burkholderiales bacterium]